MVKTIIYAANPMRGDILNWMIIFKIFNLSWHVSYTGVISLFSQILWFLLNRAWGHTDSYRLRCVDFMLIITWYDMSICTVNARIPGCQKDTRISVKFPELRLSNSISDPWFYNSVVLVLMSNSIAHGSLLMHTTDILYWTMIFKTINSSCHVCVFFLIS